MTIKSNGPIVNNKITIEDIVKKLNKMVIFNFFIQKSDKKISFSQNANAELHTKLICILGLYLGEKCDKYRCFLGLGYGDCGEFNLGNLPLDEFMAFLDSLGDIKEVKIEIS